jgi:hypothetical protein
MTIGQLKMQIEQAGLSDEDEVILDTDDGRYGIAELMPEENVLLIQSGDYIEEE